MSAPDPTLRQVVRSLVATVIAGRPVILTAAAATSTPMAELFVEAGAPAVHRVPLPDRAGSIRNTLAHQEALLASPPQYLREAIRHADPHGRAVIYAGSATAQRTCCGRNILGVRDEAHVDAERKDVQQYLLSSGPPRTRLDLTDLTAAAAIEEAAQHGPTVLQGVPKTGIAIGASHTFLVPHAAGCDRIEAVVNVLRRDCDVALLAALDVGIPCTVYGLASTNWTIDFGPFHALVFWRPDTWRLWTPGIARPARLTDPGVHFVRHAVTQAGRRLRDAIGYTGAFGTDGVSTPTGYMIHEINPRVCAGFALLNEIHPAASPLAAVDLLLREHTAEADVRLYEALSAAASTIRATDRPLVRLWNTDLHLVQQRLRAAANSGISGSAWLNLVHATLGGGAFQPIATRTPRENLA